MGLSMTSSNIQGGPVKGSHFWIM